jgi:hypothetical protein
MATYGTPRKRAGRNGAGRHASSAAAKRKGVKSLPPRRTGGSKMTRDGSNPMAHGGNC